MRRSALLCVAIAGSLLLAGCSSDSGPETDPTPSAEETPAVAEPSAADIAALAAVAVEGALSAAPTVTLEPGFTVTAPVARLDVEGTGALLEDGQSMTIDYVTISGDDGTVLESTWDTGSPARLTVGDTGIVSAMNDALRDQRVGVRILVAVPGAEATEVSDAYPSMVMVLEVLDAVDVPTRAEGEPVEPPDGLPVVTLAEDGEPSIEIPEDIVEPDELVVQTLIKGDGPVVETGQYVNLHYNGWLWDGTLFDSSWQSGSPFSAPIGQSQLIAGWDQGLVGQTVGSQVLLVIPPELGYGADGYNEIPPDSTLVFVVDLLSVL